MRLFQRALIASFMVVTTLAGSAFAQDRHVVDPSAIAATLEQQTAKQDADRAAIREAIARPEVRDTAARMGVDLERVNQSVTTLDGQDLERVASAARQVNQAFVGGASTLVISTTTIIIILLVVILLVVAIK